MQIIVTGRGVKVSGKALTLKSCTAATRPTNILQTKCSTARPPAGRRRDLPALPPYRLSACLFRDATSLVRRGPTQWRLAAGAARLAGGWGAEAFPLAACRRGKPRGCCAPSARPGSFQECFVSNNCACIVASLLITALSYVFRFSIRRRPSYAVSLAAVPLCCLYPGLMIAIESVHM